MGAGDSLVRKGAVTEGSSGVWTWEAKNTHEDGRKMGCGGAIFVLDLNKMISWDTH